MTITELLLIGILATYRLTLLLSEEDGPGDIFGKLRDRIGVKYDEKSRRFGTNVVAQAVICPYCLSVWIGWIVFGLLWAFPQAQPLALPFAFSGGVVFMKKWTG